MLRLPVCLPQSAGSISSIVLPVVSSPPFAPPSLAAIELTFLVNSSSVDHLEPELHTIFIDSIAFDVYPLSSTSVTFYSTFSVAISNLPLSWLLHDWIFPPGWKSRVDVLYHLGTLTSPMIAVSTGPVRHWDAYGDKTIVSVSLWYEVSPSMSVLQYAASFSDPLDVSRIALGMHLSGHEILVQG